ALDAVAAFAGAPLEDQFLVRLLDEDLKEPALDLEAGLMDEGLDLVGEMLILLGQGDGHLELELEGEGLRLAVDGADGDGSLEAVGITHGESPYWYYGGSSCVFLSIRPAKSPPWSGIAPR